MKLFKSKKENKVEPTHDNDALDELINDMPGSSDTSADSAQVENTAPATGQPAAKQKKSLFGRKNPKDTTADSALVENTQVVEDNSVDASDDFLATLDDKPQSSPDFLKWILGALFVLLILMILYYIYSTFLANDNTDVTAPAELPTLSEGAEPVPVLETEQDSQPQVLDVQEIDNSADVATVEGTDAQTDASTADSNELVIDTLDDIPDPEEIVSAELPQNEVMAKEEIDRLADEAKQLEEQGKLIADQVAMMDELTSKKEEQIELLEQQIALLEAQKNSQ